MSLWAGGRCHDVGTRVGTRVGTFVGTLIGTHGGTLVGTCVGTRVGTLVGDSQRPDRRVAEARRDPLPRAPCLEQDLTVKGPTLAVDQTKHVLRRPRRLVSARRAVLWMMMWSAEGRALESAERTSRAERRERRGEER